MTTARTMRYAGWAMLLLSVMARAADLKAPDRVRNSLRTLAYVQDDMSRKLTSKTYARLPHENEEFQEAAAPLRKAVAQEPGALRTQVDVQLKKAQAAAVQVAEVSKSNDEARIKTAIDKVADELRALNQLFPANVRVLPGEVHAGNGPPPALR